MKRFFALLLALMLCLSLCACGNKSGDDMQSESSGTKEFENVILADNDAVKIELVNFYAKEENWAHLGEIIEKGFTMRITNKTSSTIGFNPKHFYLDNEEVSIMMMGISDSVEAGRTAIIPYSIWYETQPYNTPVKTFDELSRLEGSFDFWANVTGKNYGVSLPDVSINIQSALSESSQN